MPIARWRFAYRAYNTSARRAGKRSATRQQTAYNVSFLLILFRFLESRCVVDIVF